jgi:hypothetical protein
LPTLKNLGNVEESKWIVRLTIQLFNLSGAVFASDSDLGRFKQMQLSLVDSLRECRGAQLELNELIETHRKEVEAGTAVEITNGNIHIHIDIEPKLNRLFKDFVSKARTALYRLYGQKSAPASVTHILLKRSISFAQVKDDALFDTEAAKFLQSMPGENSEALINLLRTDRASWISVLIAMRDRMIHDIDCPQLKMNYGIVDGKIQAGFPTVSGNELCPYLNVLWENLYQAIEETVVLCIAIRMGNHFVPYRIPDASIDPNLPFRWQLAFRTNSENTT